MGLLRRGRMVLGAILGGAALLVGVSAAAQTPTPTPSTKIGTAPLLAPSALNLAAYAGTTTNDFYASQRPKEVQLLAAALKGTRADSDFVDNVYDYVHNNIEIAWMFGLQKGALGAIIDHSGTAFDQAHLMVETLRAGGVAATYQFGTATLNDTEWKAWSGLTSATATCQLLAAGGIPAAINGSSIASCAYGSAPVTTITLSHVWVKAWIGGTAYQFDPARKTHDIKVGDAALPGQIQPGGALNAATSVTMTGGTQSGASYVRSLNAGGLETTLNGYAHNVQCLIEGGVIDGSACAGGGAHATDAVDDLVGGLALHKDHPATPLRQTTLSYLTPGAGAPAECTSVTAAWNCGVPDKFRTKMTVLVTRKAPGNVLVTVVNNKALFVDDTYGRKLELVSRDQPEGGASGADRLLMFDETGAITEVSSFTSGYGATDIPMWNDADITLTIDHPYPDAGTGQPRSDGYMDAVVAKHVFMWMPLVIVNGWGDVGRGYVDKWGARDDSEAPYVNTADTGCADSNQGCNPYAPSAGDGRREQLAAAWLTQSGRAARLHAAIADARYTHHHSVGIVSAETRVKTIYQGQTTNILGHSATDSFDRIDIDTAFSLTSETGDASSRRAAVHAIAETLEILEGSVAGQIGDLPDTTSVATRFAWGNAPPAPDADTRTDEDPSGAGPRRFYTFAAGSTTPDITKFEGADAAGGVGTHTGSTPTFDSGESGQWRGALSSAIQAYATAGFDVVASEESFLGPGQRAGAFNKSASTIYTHLPTFQRGGALVATKYVNGEPVEIANATMGTNFLAKGGGGGAQPGHQAQYDPSKAADVLKARFVDRSKAVGVDLLSGGITYSSPATLAIGQGEFPDKLTAEIFWRGGEVKGYYSPPGHTEPQTPWSTNWHNMLSVSGSGMEAMGVTDIRAAGGTVAAFMAMQDVYKAAASPEREVAAQLVGAWWARQMVHNVVTVNIGANTQQFVRRYYDNSWFSPGAGGYATLVQNGTYSLQARKCGGGQVSYVLTKGWKFTGAGFTVTGAHGDVQTFAYWEKQVRDDAFCSDMHGFRLATWAFPKGVTVTLHYTDMGTYDQDLLDSISNNLGRQLTYTYNAGTLSGVTDGTRTISIGVEASTGYITHTDAASKVTKLATTWLGGFGNNGVGGRYRLTDIRAADLPDGTPAIHYDFDSLSRVASAKDRLNNTYTFGLGFGVWGERTDPKGGRYAVEYDDDKRPVRFTDEIGRVVSAAYDGRGRIKAYTYPEGDTELLAYDDRNNQIGLTKGAKPGSGEAGQQLTITASYDPTWNKVARLTDAKGLYTDFTYYAAGQNGAGEMHTATRMPVPGGTPVYIFTYNGYGQLASTIDPTGLTTTNGYDANHYLSTTAVDPNGINAVTTRTNNAYGDPVDIDGPRTDVSDVSHVSYDAMRRKLVESRPDTGTGRATATRTTYDNVGRPTVIDQGYVSGGVFAPLITTTLDLDAVGNKIKETTPAGVTQFSYDGLNRLVCTAKRNNPTAPLTDACMPTAAGLFGPDQISENEYDLAGQLTATRIGFHANGNSDPGVAFISYSYTPNGQKASVTDGVGNRTDLAYDGFDRLKAQYFPSKTRAAGVSDPSDFEAYVYDANSNRIQLVKRDKTVFNFGYDDNDRMKEKLVGGHPEMDTSYTYDLAGRITSSLYKANLQGMSYTYDAAGRVTAETSYAWAVGFGLDKAGNRVSLTWPGGQAVEYVYDAANQLTRVREPGATSGPGVLADLQYDDLGRRTHLLRGNGGHGDYAYDPAGRLASLTQAGLSSMTASVQTIAYTPASQIASLTQTKLNYVWTGRSPFSNETYDGQNRIYSSVAINGYDANGNLTTTGQHNYKYDAENHLIYGTTADGSNLTLAYDPAGRLRSTVSNTGAATYFLYAGDQLIGEYAASGASEPSLRKYVYGSGADEPIADYEGSNTSQRRWLHPDRQGSIIAVSDASGELVQTYPYGPWGETDTWAGQRFRYTGQIALPELQAYHYKARVYDPILGRFLQTDPIGQKDDPNLYPYVRDDPVNRTDPSGLEGSSFYGDHGSEGGYFTAGPNDPSTRQLMGLTLAYGGLWATALFDLPAAAGLAARAPGAWVAVSESMSQRALAFQVSQGGRAGMAYLVNGVKFDAIAGRTLVEVKSSLAQFVGKDGAFQSWFRGSEGLVDQAQRQLVAAGGKNPIVWRVEDAKTARAIQNLFKQNNIVGITVKQAEKVCTGTRLC